MEIQKINLKRLTKEYNRFLMGNENIGCPMLATALSKIIGGKPTVGYFDKQPHCWVRHNKHKRIYDLNNLVGQIVCLIVSDIDDVSYKNTTTKPRDFAFELGLRYDSNFNKWVTRFQKAMQEVSSHSSQD